MNINEQIKISLAGQEKGIINPINEGLQVYATHDNLLLSAYNNVKIVSATGTWIQLGDIHNPSYVQIYEPIVLGQGGPNIMWGHGDPQPNSSIADGSLYICQDATSALWIKRQGKWERVFTDSYHK